MSKDVSKFDFSVDIPNDTNATIHIYPGTKRKHLRGMDYAIVFLEMFSQLASDKELNLTDRRVLDGLVAHLDFGNEINVSQGTLAKELGIKRPNVSSSIKKLIQKNYILVLKTQGRQNIYQLNPHYGMKAKPEDKRMLDRAWDERKKVN